MAFQEDATTATSAGPFLDCCGFCFAWMVLPKSKRQKPLKMIVSEPPEFQGEFPFQVPAVSFRRCNLGEVSFNFAQLAGLPWYFFWFRSWNGCTRKFVPLPEARISEKEGFFYLLVYLDTAWKESSKQHLFHFFLISPSTRPWKKKLQPIFVTSLNFQAEHDISRHVPLFQHGTSFDNQDPGGKKGLETARDLVEDAWFMFLESLCSMFLL